MAPTLGTTRRAGLVGTRHAPLMEVPRGTPEAILRPTDAERAITVDRVPASAALEAYVDYHWYVGWRTAEPHRQQVVPQPRIHVVAEVLDDERRVFVHG